MTPEEKQQFEELKKRVERIEGNEQLLSGFKGVTDTDIDVTITIGAGGGSEQVLDFPDDLILIRYNGKIGRIPWYSETRF